MKKLIFALLLSACTTTQPIKKAAEAPICPIPTPCPTCPICPNPTPTPVPTPIPSPKPTISPIPSPINTPPIEGRTPIPTATLPPNLPTPPPTLDPNDPLIAGWAQNEVPYGKVYHVANAPCLHSRTIIGNDANDGLTRETAFLTVQKCLNKMKAGDTCVIHYGEYVGNFNCCGNDTSTITTLLGTKLKPTRILGASGEMPTLRGTNTQTPVTLSNYYGTNLGTLTMKGSSSGSQFFEVGNLQLEPGNSASLVITRAKNFYVHDIKITDTSLFACGNSENCGLFWGYSPENYLINRVDISNHGTIKIFNAFALGGFDGKIRMVDIKDMEGAIQGGHFDNNITWEFIKVRNWNPFTDDDGGLKDQYNSQSSTMRYISAKRSGGINPLYAFLNSRRTDCAGVPTLIKGQRASVYWDHISLEDNPTLSNVGYGAFHHAKTWITTGGADTCVTPYLGVVDWNLTNSVAYNFKVGINVRGNNASQGVDCDRHKNDYNGWFSIQTPLSFSGTNNCGPKWALGQNDIIGTNPNWDSNGAPVQNSGLIDKGDPSSPIPLGGGTRSDIGAYEAGASYWPYQFQEKWTTSQTPKICWEQGQVGCDIQIEIDDPYYKIANGRLTNPHMYWIEIDEWNHFRSGNQACYKGQCAQYSTGPVNSTDRFFQVPAGVLQNGKSYYLRARIGEQATKGSEHQGPGAWSVKFYRFKVQ